MSNSRKTTQLPYLAAANIADDDALHLVDVSANRSKQTTVADLVSLISGGVGTGTVTNVSVVTANGVSGSVANPTTTPAITLTLGDIVPSSVNSVVISGASTPTLLVTGATQVSGVNTGNQTFTASGDATAPGSTSNLALTLASVVTAGSIGSASNVPIITYDAKGRITGTTSATVIAAAGTLTGTTLASNVTNSSLQTLGTITAGVWTGTPVAVLNGGTGATTASGARTNLGLVIGTNVFTQRTITGTANEITVTNGDGVSANPTISIPTAVTFTGKTVTGGTYSGPTISGTVTDSGTTTKTGTLNATGATFSVNKIANLTSNGFVKTTGGDGTLSIDTSTYITANQTITLSGDVTGSGSTAITTTIANDAVTNAKLANVATQTFKGRTTASTGDPEDLTVTQATAMLNVFGADAGSGGVKGLVPATTSGDAVKVLYGDGTWKTPTSGTVTSVSVVTANGVSGSVATATTTPAITLSLGAITPTSVNSVAISGGSTPTLAVTGTTTVSGANTGDQLYTISGDATAPSSASTLVLTLATVNSNVGSFGSSTSIPNFTVNAKGLVTAAGSNVVVAPAGTLTGTTLAGNVVTSSLTAVGTIGTGVWQGTKVGLAYGGTNADLSATGGTSRVLMQTSAGANVTVAQLAASNLSNGTTGTGAVVLAGAPTVVGGSFTSLGSLSVRSTGSAFDLAIASQEVMTGNRTLTLYVDDADRVLNVYGNSSINGFNSGDQLYTITGDGTAPSSSSTLALTLATVNSNVGSFGGSTSIPSLTVNAKGLVTAIANNAVVAPAGTLTGTTLASNVVTSSLTTVGTITSGTWTGTTIAVANGGTGATTASGARTNLGLVIGTDVQAWDPQLDSLATLAYSGNGGKAVRVNAGETGFELYTPSNSTITLSGDVSGSGTSSITTTLATVNSDIGTFGSSTSIPSLTVNAKGLVTAAGGNVVIAPAGTLTGTTLASNVVTSSLTAVGTVGTGVWQATKVGLVYGGTNADLSATGGTSQVLKQASSGANITVGQLAASDLSNGTSGSGAVALVTSPTFTTPTLGAAAFTSLTGGTIRTTAGGDTNFYAWNGTAYEYLFFMQSQSGTVYGDLSTKVTIGGNTIYQKFQGGNFGIAVRADDGGTGRLSATAYAVICGGTTSTSAQQSVSGVGTTGQVLTSNGASALPTWQNAAASGGTVTSVSVVTANGVSGSVATATTTPAITLTLGDITPTTVTASGKVRSGVGANGVLSLWDNANSREITLTAGNAVLTLGGTGNPSLSLASNLLLPSGGELNWNGGDVKISHSADLLTVSGGNLSLGSNSISSGNWQGSTVAVGFGGTGRTNFVAYAPVCGGTSTTAALQSTTAGNSGEVFVSQGSSNLPVWSTFDALMKVWGPTVTGYVGTNGVRQFLTHKNSGGIVVYEWVNVSSSSCA